MTFATIGTISHGTLRNADLLETFADELEYLDKHACREVSEATHTGNEIAEFTDVSMHRRRLIDDARLIDPDHEDAAELVQELIDALNDFAPFYAYFGAHPGDGSDFGFWPDWNSIDELPRVADPADVESACEDCVFVNDHGNVTVYGADGSIIWDCV